MLGVPRRESAHRPDFGQAGASVDGVSVPFPEVAEPTVNTTNTGDQRMRESGGKDVMYRARSDSRPDRAVECPLAIDLMKVPAAQIEGRPL